MPKIFFDASTKGNPGKSTCAAVIITEKKRHHFTKELGVLDNHQAEWEALLFSIEKALELKVETALIYTDSKLIEDSINKGFVKNKAFKHYYETFKAFENRFTLIFVKWIPRDQNKEANQLAQQTLRKLLKKQKNK